MIFDEIKNIGRYLGISHNLDTAIAFIQTTDLAALPLGKTEIDGANVFANVMEAQTSSEEKLQYEFHKKYMDIQIDLDGIERINSGIAVEGGQRKFDEASDFGTVESVCAARCTMGPGRFIVCMAQEPHMPGACPDKSEKIRKCVIKVAAQP